MKPVSPDELEYQVLEDQQAVDIALNGGPMDQLTEAISFVVSCRTQAEVDRYWKRLSAGRGTGALRLAQGPLWAQLADRARLLGGADRGVGASGAQRAMDALPTMGKFDIRNLKAAYSSHE